MEFFQAPTPAGCSLLESLKESYVCKKTWTLVKMISISAALVVIGLLRTPAVLAEDKFTVMTVNEKMGYQATSSGNPLSLPGAQVTISAERADAGAFGGPSYKTGPERWVNKVATLSATIDVATLASQPAIWLRADGSSGKALKFATSANRVIPADGHVSIDLRIPPDTASVVFGLVMHGSGRTSAKYFKLVESEHHFPGSEASARQVYDEAVRIVSKNAYWSSNLQKSRQNQKIELSTAPGTGYQAEKSIRALLRELKDSHSLYLTAEQGLSYSDGGGTPDSAEVELVDGKFGYVSIPGVFGTNPALAKEFAAKVGGKLNDLRAGARCGWVVDLRKDNGGNMWPMVSALSIFFGKERLGGFKTRNGDINWWSINSPKVIAVSGASEAQEAKIAVLIGPKTTSSGEAVAVAFIGRKNTRSFGAPSNGRASSNRRFELADGSGIWLMSAVDVDRSGQEVGERIVPDTRLPDDVVSNSEIPREALSWLSSSCPPE